MGFVPGVSQEEGSNERTKIRLSPMFSMLLFHTCKLFDRFVCRVDLLKRIPGKPLMKLRVALSEIYSWIDQRWYELQKPLSW
jgi:hypothetical protein